MLKDTICSKLAHILPSEEGKRSISFLLTFVNLNHTVTSSDVTFALKGLAQVLHNWAANMYVSVLNLRCWLFANVTPIKFVIDAHFSRNLRAYAKGPHRPPIYVW